MQKRGELDRQPEWGTNKRMNKDSEDDLIFLWLTLQCLRISGSLLLSWHMERLHSLAPSM